MRSWLGLSVSVLALAGAAATARGQEIARPEADRFSTEVLLAPLSFKAPNSPSLSLGVTRIEDAARLGLDAIVTGQIAKPAPTGSADSHRPSADALAAAPAEGAAGHGEAAAAPVSLPAAPILGEPAAETATARPGEPEAETPEIVPEHEAMPASAEGGAPHDASAEPAGGAAPPPPAAEGALGEAAPVFAAERGPAPYDIIRTIQFLQDQVARGNGRAIRVQSALLRRFGPVFLAADRTVWADERNQRAAVLFVLSGGPPDVLRRLMETGDFDAERKALLDGALAYVQNDLEKAGRLLATVDLDGMEPGLAAHLYLVLGQIQQMKDPDSAVRNLDQARLLAPGGLIEEAALRMEVLIAEGRGDAPTADRLARQYFDRYARSSYSANFEARFAAVYAGRKNEDPDVSVATILDVTDRLPADSRRGLLLAVARRSLVDGKLKLAELASDAAGAIDGMPAAEKQRAELYATAARLGKTVTRDSAALLDAIDRAELHPEDIKLLDAAHSVVAGIERPLDPPEDAGDDADMANASPVFERAQKLLDEVQSDLGKVQK
ncbi:hypothetical protein ASG43_12850 [Aureimonas sp. Leaf454]|uniref:hypothetical protein n=1 Tax=Aureimonas sp. Leaf454 TaxID=1736381 RepID=UPI0006FD1592|nr:hypothetical protein [Aureimonas sp. Leaf454]KQT45176.1 hypothetical protein ASG43_12850 [Aureimonas sp. Leaf454]